MRQNGFSLVELMVSLALGMIVIGAATSVYISTFAGNASQLKMARLNGDLRIAMTQVSRDLRRAGYHNWTLNQLALGNYLSSPQIAPTLAASAADIRYDENSNGAAEPTEDYGFRWVDKNGDGTNDTLQARIGGGAWSDLTDPAVISITNFAITNNSPAAVNPAGAVAAVTVPIYTVTITGQLVTDAAVQRTIRETVRIRNPILVPNP